MYCPFYFFFMSFQVTSRLDFKILVQGLVNVVYKLIVFTYKWKIGNAHTDIITNPEIQILKSSHDVT